MFVISIPFPIVSTLAIIRLQLDTVRYVQYELLCGGFERTASDRGSPLPPRRADRASTCFNAEKNLSLSLSLSL